jgi:hypothetical protein
VPVAKGRSRRRKQQGFGYWLAAPALVLRRQLNRPSLTAFDRALMVVASAIISTWRESVLLVKPETITPAGVVWTGSCASP